MKSLKNSTRVHLKHYGPSLQRTWVVLVTIVLFLLVLEFRYLWQHVDLAPGDSNSNLLHQILRQGYSHSSGEKSGVSVQRGTLKDNQPGDSNAVIKYRISDTAKKKDDLRDSASMRDEFLDPSQKNNKLFLDSGGLKSQLSVGINNKNKENFVDSLNNDDQFLNNKEKAKRANSLNDEDQLSKIKKEQNLNSLNNGDQFSDGDKLGEDVNKGNKKELDSGAFNAKMLGNGANKKSPYSHIQGGKVDSVAKLGKDTRENSTRQLDPVFPGQYLRYIKDARLKPGGQWIVVDTTRGECPRNVSSPSGWTTLIAGQQFGQGHIGCELPSCFSLQPDADPKNGDANEGPVWWKNLAYLTALTNGARFILDADCSVNIAEAVRVLKFSPSGKDHGLMYNETLLFNPYAHFGAWGASPRAVSTSSPANSRLYYVRDFDHSVLVKHGLRDSSADLKTRTNSGRNSGARFDRSSPPVFVGQKSYTAAIPACSLYRREASWALLLPCFSYTQRCLLLRLLLFQRLLREVDGFSGFYPMKTSKSSPVLLLESESLDVPVFVRFLDAWKCAPNLTFYGCVYNLLDEAFKQGSGFITKPEISLMKSWIAALKSSGVAEPVRAKMSWRGVRRISEVRVTYGSVQSQLESGGKSMEQNVQKWSVEPAKTNCNGSESKVNWFPVAQWKSPLMKEVVLVVVFNTGRFFWNNLPYLETMHRPFFRNIVYCVPDVNDILMNNRTAEFPYLTLVEGLSDQWYMMYECLTSVARMNLPGVQGYLQIGDDTLLNTWRLFNVSRDSMWMPRGFTTMRADESTHLWHWYWWKKSRGRPAALQALADLERLSGLSNEQLLHLDPNLKKSSSNPKVRPATTFSEIFKKEKDEFAPNRPFLKGSEVFDQPSKADAVKFLTNYYGSNRLSGLLAHRAMDLFYIPQKLIADFVKFSRYFMSHNVIIELAVPTIHFGLAKRSDVRYLKASSLWEHDRTITSSFYNDSNFFLHPFKMKANMAQKQGRTLFCEVYMRTLFSEMTKHVKR